MSLALELKLILYLKENIHDTSTCNLKSLIQTQTQTHTHTYKYYILNSYLYNQRYNKLLHQNK